MRRGRTMAGVINGVISCAGAGITVVGIAAHAMLRTLSDELAEVFA